MPLNPYQKAEKTIQDLQERAKRENKPIITVLQSDPSGIDEEEYGHHIRRHDCDCICDDCGGE